MIEQLAVGTRLRYLGRIWLVERVNKQAGHGPLLAIADVDGTDTDLICGAGCDGKFEVLPACEISA